MVNSNDVVKWGYLLDPCFQFQNTAGKPLTEGYIEVYIAGTRDKYYCASDFDGTLHPFQIPLDSLGANIVLADPEQAYDVYVYNKFGSLQMSRYNVSPGNAGGAVAANINITSSDNTINVTHTGNNYDLSIQDTINRIDNLENVVSGITGETDYVISTGYGAGGTFVLTDKEYKGIQYLSDMSGWRLKPGHIYQLNFNSKFTLDDNYNTLVEGKLYLDGDMSFSQDWAYSLDDSFDHIKHINGSTVIVVPDTLQYYDLKLKYTFNSVVNCQVDLENISLVDITSIVLNNGGSGSDYYAGDGININNNYISVDMEYINNQIDIDSKLSSAINIANNYTDNSIEEVVALVTGVTGGMQQVNSDWEATSGVAEILHKPDLSVYATHQEVINSVSAATAVLEQEIQDIPEQVQSDWEQTNTSAVDYIKNKPEETSVEFTDLVAGNNISITASGSSTVISSNVDLTNYATHNEVYSATTSAVSSANSYTDTAISNIDLTPAVEIVSPNSSISVSSVTDSANNTKTFYIDTNNPDVNYWIGESRLTLSDQSSQGQVGYYKDVFDYADKLNGNLDATKLKRGLYLLTANVMIVADEVNNDLAEIQICSDSSSAISYTSSVFPHDCSVTDTLGEPMDESHQIATIVRVMYDDTPMSLIARMDDPTTISNELHLWFSDIGLYELQGTSAGGGSSPSASGSYDAGWGIVINGNVISVNQNIIPDISNLASTTYVDNRIASAINIVEGEIPDVSDMATKTWVNSQGYLTEQVQSDWTEYNSSDPAYIKNKPLEANLVAGNNISIAASGNNIIISSTASAASGVTYRAGTGIDITGDVISVDNTVAMKSDITDMATKTWVNNQGYLTSIPSYYATDTEVANAIATAVSSIPAQVQSDWTEDNTSDPSYIQNKPTVSTLVAGENITITASGDNVVISSTGGSSGTSYTAGTGIDITNNTISIDNTVALKTDIPDTTDMATKTWVGQQGYLTSVPSTYATDAEVSAAIATAIASVPAQVQSNWTESASASPAYIQNKPDEVSVDFCPIIAGSNITITASGDSAVISSTGGGGGSTYTAGTGIDITSDVISVDNTVALKSEIAAVSGKLPTTETGKFTIQNNVSGGPIEVICPTDQAPDAVYYQINSVSGNVYANSSYSGVVNYYYGETPADFNGSDDGVLITINDNISNIYSIALYYSNSVSGIGGPSLSTTIINGDSNYVLQSGTYRVKATYNSGSSYGYGNYLQIMFNWRNSAADVAQSLQWTQDALSKITFFGVGRPDPALGTTVNLDRYYLGNTSTTTSTSSLTQATIYTDPDTKKQSVYLPSSMPSNWLNRVANYVQYGSNYFTPGSYNTSQQYIAYKYTSNSPIRYQYAICTDYDYTNRKMTFISYNERGKAIEKWTVNYSTYSSNIWTTETLSYEAEIQAVSGALNNYIPYSASGIYLPNSKFEIDTEGQAYKVITPGSESSYNRFDDGGLFFGYYGAQVGTYKAILPSNTDNIGISKNQMELTSTYDSATHTATFNITAIPSSSSYAYIYAYDSNNNLIILNNSNTTVKYVVQGVKDEYITVGDLELNGNNQVSAIDGYELAGGSSVALSGASGVKVEDSVVSLDNPVGLVAGENITITVSGDSAIIAGQAGGGSSYTAGTGIDITNNVISVTDPNKVFIATYMSTTFSQIQAALNAGKEVVCKYSGEPSYGTVYLPLVYCDGYNTFFQDQVLREGIKPQMFLAKCRYAGGWSTTLTDYDPLQVQANWNETSSSSKAYIQNKPDLSSFVTSTTASAIAEAEVANIDVCPIIAGQNVTITASGSSAVIDVSVDTSTLATKAELQTVSAAIPDTSDMATKTWVGNQGYLTSIPSSYATDVEVTQAVTGATQNMVSYSGNTAINHIQLVSTLPGSPDSNTLYLIPEA